MTALLPSALDRKRLDTIKARAALLAIVVHVLDDDHGNPLLIASRGALTKSFATLDALADWLDTFPQAAGHAEGDLYAG